MDFYEMYIFYTRRVILDLDIRDPGGAGERPGVCSNLPPGSQSMDYIRHTDEIPDG